MTETDGAVAMASQMNRSSLTGRKSSRGLVSPSILDQANAR
ncbi:hypothetical protein [Mycobacterium seoulense]